jgi:serpin B
MQLNRAVKVGMACAGLLWTYPNATPAEPKEEDRHAVVAGHTQFALDLYARFRSEDGNLFLAPHSISTALAMTYAGARGDTASQMARVLHYPPAQERLHPALAELESDLNAAGHHSGCTLHPANALWAQQGYGFLDEFLAVVRRHYGAAFRTVDFAGDAEHARQAINTWVASRTEATIPELLRESDLDPSDVLVLANAVYFHGSWASRFDPELTHEAPFRISPSEQTTVAMMHQTGRFPFTSGDHLDVLEMPYDGDRLSMLLLLPKKVGGLPDVENLLSTENIDRWLGLLRQQAVNVSLPRFSLGFRADLAKTLEAMGMSDAFHGRVADFSGMTGRRDLFIGAVMHQAQVEVNEEGTEATTATAVTLKKGCPVPTFAADHPFLFLIRDRETGCILFIGRVVNPEV